MAIPAPTQDTSARVFVVAEVLSSLTLSILLIFITCAIAHYTDSPWWAVWMSSMLSLLVGMAWWMIMIGYRLLNYLLHFIGMADLLDATRIAITSLFAPSRRQ